MKKVAILTAAVALAAGLLGPWQPTRGSSPLPDWDVAGTWTGSSGLLGHVNDYPFEMTLTQDADGNVSGTIHYDIGIIRSVAGEVSGSTFVFITEGGNYWATCDNCAIAADGSSFTGTGWDTTARQVEWQATGQATRLVDIDIKPGTDANSVNPRSQGVIAVAVLTTEDFDTTTVDPATVEFAGASPKRWTLKDVDLDGDLDLVLHFKTQETDIAAGNDEACLEGSTVFGVQFQGCDAIRIADLVSITFWHSMTAANEEVLKELVRRFNTSQDEVIVTLAFQGSYNDSLNKLLASLGSPRELPALVQIEDVSTQLMIDSGEISPVQDFIDREGYDLSSFEPRVLDYYRVGDRLYSMPFNISGPILYYDKNDFGEVGLDPENPPQTLEEVAQWSEVLLRRDSSGNVTRSGIALEVAPWHFEQMLAKAGALFANNGNGRDGRPTEAVFNGPEGRAIFQWWAEMVESGLAFNVGRNPSGADGLVAVASDRASMTIASSAALGTVLDIMEAGGADDVDLGVGPMPAPQSPDGGVIVGGASLWIMKDRPEPEERAAWKFIKFLVDPAQQAAWYAGTGYFPMRSDAYDEPEAQETEARYPYLRVAPEQLQQGADNRATQGALLGPFARIRNEVVATAIESMILTGVSPEDAIDDAASDATRLIQEYNEHLGE